MDISAIYEFTKNPLFFWGSIVFSVLVSLHSFNISNRAKERAKFYAGEEKSAADELKQAEIELLKLKKRLESGKITQEERRS